MVKIHRVARWGPLVPGEVPSRVGRLRVRSGRLARWIHTTLKLDPAVWLQHEKRDYRHCTQRLLRKKNDPTRGDNTRVTGHRVQCGDFLWCGEEARE